jgi:predicted GNAT family acetyltransferase
MPANLQDHASTAPGVRDNPGAARFELPLPDGSLAFIDYRRVERQVEARQAAAVWLTHAEVPPAWEGRGVGSRLVQGTLDRIRAAGERVVPVCSFVVAWMRRHPDYDDLRQ